MKINEFPDVPSREIILPRPVPVRGRVGKIRNRHVVKVTKGHLYPLLDISVLPNGLPVKVITPNGSRQVKIVNTRNNVCLPIPVELIADKVESIMPGIDYKVLILGVIVNPNNQVTNAHALF